jgi:phospholipid/cholesterol/gamma-HCH transport system permease protein
MATAIPGRIPQRIKRRWELVVDQLVWFGNFLIFMVKAVVAVPQVLKNWSQEVWRLLAEIAFGDGLLAAVAGTVGVIFALTAFVGLSIGLEGYQGLQVIGLAPLTGFVSAFANTREIAPLITAFGIGAQLGCRFTAQLGAMRITEEIDALEVMAVPSLAYLVTTRMIAALLAILPLYLLGLFGSYLATQLTVTVLQGQSVGTYLHYFHLFLTVKDVLLSCLKVVIFAVIIVFIHCYYGYNAKGGPEGVGRAAGRAIRADIVTIAFTDMLLTLLFWGTSTSFRVGG